jgi:hypothetical protein
VGGVRRIGFGAKEGLPDLGSRLALVSDDRQALPLWTDTRAGTPATQKQDLAMASATFSKPPGASPAESGLRYGGLGLGLTGLGLLALWLRPISMGSAITWRLPRRRSIR